MSGSSRVAELLNISTQEAVVFCEKVRTLSGIGTPLQYKVIAQCILENCNQPPTSEIIAGLAKAKIHEIRKLQPNLNASLPKSSVSLPIQLNSNSVTYSRSTPALPEHGLANYSYLDRERISEEKLPHCPHGILFGRACAICDPKKFREMTGID